MKGINMSNQANENVFFDIHAFAAKYEVKVITDIKKMPKIDCYYWNSNLACLTNKARFQLIERSGIGEELCRNVKVDAMTTLEADSAPYMQMHILLRCDYQLEIEVKTYKVIEAIENNLVVEINRVNIIVNPEQFGLKVMLSADSFDVIQHMVNGHDIRNIIGTEEEVKSLREKLNKSLM